MTCTKPWFLSHGFSTTAHKASRERIQKCLLRLRLPGLRHHSQTVRSDWRHDWYGQAYKLLNGSELRW